MTQPPLVIPATVEVPQAEKTTLANGATLYTLASDDFEVLRHRPRRTCSQKARAT